MSPKVLNNTYTTFIDVKNSRLKRHQNVRETIPTNNAGFTCE